MNIFFRSIKVILICFLVPFVLMAQDNVEEKGYITSPAFTSHGIVFTDNYASAIYITTNNETRELISAAGCGRYYSVAPDGNLLGIKLIDNEGKQTPAILDPATNALRKLYEPSALCGQVSFTRDGRYAFTVGKQLIVMGNGSTEKHDLGYYANLAPVSPDGNYVAYNNSEDQILLLDLKRNSTQKISDGQMGYFNPMWSPDGKILLYSGLNGLLKTYDVENNRTYVIGEGLNPAWSADSRSIAFSRREMKNDRLINSDIYISASDGSHLQKMTDTPGIFEMDPGFSMDNSSIVYHTYASRELHVASLSPDKSSLKETKVILPSQSSYIRYFAPESRMLLKTKALDMPYVNQVYDTPDYFNGSSACGATTAIMVIAYYNLLPEWDILCTYHQPSHITHWGRYICDEYNFRSIDYAFSTKDPNGRDSWGGFGYMWNGGGSPYSTIANYYNLHGITSVRTDAPPHSDAVNEINAGYPYTMCVALTTAGHIVAAHGLGTESHTLVFNDPYGDKNKPGYPNYYGKGAQYDWPGYNNGFQNLKTVWWCVTSRGSQPAPADTVVDDLQFNKGFHLNTQAPASMRIWRDKTSGYKGHFWYTYTTSSDSVDTCYAEWRPNLTNDGTYEVSAYIPYSTSTAAQYKIFFKGGTKTVTINQKNIKDNWVSLGAYNFEKGNSGYVRLGDASPVKKEAIVFDAVRWSFKGTVANVEETRGIRDYELKQNYPNPFNPVTKISYTIPENCFVSLRIYDAMGQEVATLVSEEKAPGRYESEFSGNIAGKNLGSGVYFYTLRAGNSTFTKKMILLK